MRQRVSEIGMGLAPRFCLSHHSSSTARASDSSPAPAAVLRVAHEPQLAAQARRHAPPLASKPPAAPGQLIAEMSAQEHSPTATMVEPTDSSEKLEKLEDKQPELAPGLEVEDGKGGVANPNYPKGLQLFAIICALELNVFIIALDQTIIAPATPVLSNQFNALADIGWYTSAYLMTTTAIQPFYARLFGLFHPKVRSYSKRRELAYVYLSTITIFEIGSLICATAQSSKAFIVGRAIAGTGLAGGYVGTMIIISICTPVEKQPLWTSLIGMAYGGGAVVGPIIGGALTTEVTWRWCGFWINLPIGGLTIALVVLFLHLPSRPVSKTIKHDLLRLDYVGTGLLLAAVTCFLLVCQYGGLTWAWSDSRTIGLLVGAAAIGAAWVVWEGYWGEDASVPLRLLKQRTIAWGALTNSLVAGAYFAILTFMSVWFQAVQGSSAIRAGVQTLPFISSAIFFTIAAGVFTTALGYYNPPLIFGFVLGSIGAGLLYTLDADSSLSMWVGYQFLAGVVGASFQLTFIASQTVHEAGPDRERGGSIVIFFQTLGGCLFAGAAQVIYTNKFTNAVLAIPGLPNAQKIASSGATAFRDIGLSASLVDQIVAAAVDSLKYSFILAAAAGALGAFTALGLEWNDVRKVPGALPGTAEQPAAMEAGQASPVLAEKTEA